MLSVCAAAINAPRCTTVANTSIRYRWSIHKGCLLSQSNQNYKLNSEHLISPCRVPNFGYLAVGTHTMNKPEAFDEIYARASERKGGPERLESLLPEVLTPDELQQYSDAELLSAMSKQVFQSGFVWKVVEQKWPLYQQAFFDFEPSKVLMLSPEQIQQRAADPQLIRHLKKTQAIYDNAQMVREIAQEHGSLARYIALWPVEEIVGLWLQLKQRGARLGGNTGPYFLRNIGKDTFLLTDDVKGYFKAHQLVDASFTSLSGLNQVQAVFNHWQQCSGRSMAQISRILSCSVGDNRI